MFGELIKRYENELLNSVIPFWVNNCEDREYGGYFTCLDRDGSVYDTYKYMWMQWRIVYMFGEFYMSEYSRPEYLDIARRGFDFLDHFGRSPDGSYYFALNRRGEPAIVPYNVYSECFAAMGCAMLYKATGEEKYQNAAELAMANYIRRIDGGNPAGPWNKSLPGRTAYITLGHYMMLANLGLIMDDAFGGKRYERELDRAVDAVLQKFWQPEQQIMLENVLPDGTPDLSGCTGRMLNPGHVLEAMWFLLNALGQRQSDPATMNKICAVIKSTLELGWDKKFGGIYYFMDALGKPQLELQHDMKLWWPHNEALIATLFAYKHSKDDVFLEWFERIDQWSWKHFPDPQYGEWFAYLNRRGEPTHLLKGGKWKTFFHLPRCLYLCIQQMKQLDKIPIIGAVNCNGIRPKE